MPRLRTNVNQGRNQRSFWRKLKDNGLTPPGYNYLGPFNAENNGPPRNPSDLVAQEHDAGYKVLSKRGANPYLYYNEADADADAQWGDDYGGRIAKRVFRAKRELARRNIIGEIPPGRTQPTIQPSLRGNKRKQPEGFSRIESASKRFQRMIEDVRSHQEDTPVVNSTARQQVEDMPDAGTSTGSGDGSGNQGGLKETPIDDVWNVTRGPPNYTFASLPWESYRISEVSRNTNDWVYRMTSPYDPEHAIQVSDINTGTGANTHTIANDTDTSQFPARWYNYYASQYRYYHVVSARWRLTFENLSTEPMWVHIMYRNDEAPADLATNQDMQLWAGTKSYYVPALAYAIESDGNAETNEKVANTEDQENVTMAAGLANYESGNHVAIGRSNIITPSDEYRPGDYNREVRLDTDVENWTRVNANPLLPERLFIRVRPDIDGMYLNSSESVDRTNKYRFKFDIEYLTEFKELQAGLRFPIQRQPAIVTIQQDGTASRATASEVANPNY